MPHIEMPTPNLPEDYSKPERLKKLPYYVDDVRNTYSTAEAYKILSDSDAEIIGEGFESIVLIAHN